MDEKLSDNALFAKISQLDPLVSQAANDLYEFSANGTHSYKESRAQMKTYMQNNILPYMYTSGMRLSFIDTFKVQVASGACKDSTNAYNIFFPSELNIDKSISGAGGLDTGVVQSNTTYYLKVIHDVTGANPDDTIFSLSSGDPTYPAGYSTYLNRGTIETGAGFFSDFLEATLIDFYFFSSTNLLPKADPIFSGSISQLEGNYSFNGTTFCLVAGEGAHETGGNGHVLLGKGATSIFNNCLVFCDGTNSTAGNYFPGAANQVCLWAAGGVGIGVIPNGGVLQGPQAGFHYGHNAGNDGKIILSAAGAVDNAVMSPNEVNFYVDPSTAKFNIKYASNAGGIQTVSFPTGDHLMAQTDDTVLTGITSTDLISTGVLLANGPAFFPATETAYSATSTISAADLVQKTITCAPVGNIVLTLPTGALFNAAFGIASPPVNTALENISISNASVAGNVTIAAGVGFTIIGGAPIVIPPGATRWFKARKSTTAPAFILYGSGI